MQAIETKYLGPTNCRGSRIKASCQAGSLVSDYDYGLNTSSNHIAAALGLIKKLEWERYGNWFGGCTKGSGMAFVCDFTGVDNRAAEIRFSKLQED